MKLIPSDLNACQDEVQSYSEKHNKTQHPSTLNSQCPATNQIGRLSRKLKSMALGLNKNTAQ